MYIIRDAHPQDLKALWKLARYLNSYNLPANQKSLREILRSSQRSFRSDEGPHEKGRFLFILEDTKTRKIIGSSLILSQHGSRKSPHLAFELKTITKRSRTLKKSVKHVTLKLIRDTRRYTEVGGLVVLPSYRHRKEKIGKQLSYVRFPYMARFRRKFCKNLLVEYLPPVHPKKGNPFWRALGQKFTGLHYSEADLLSAKNKEFILSLFPKEKIYGSLLPESVVRALQKTGNGGTFSLKMLNRIGFRFLNHVDPFDGGPYYGASFDQVSLIRKSKMLRYERTFQEVKFRRGSQAMVLHAFSGHVRAVVTHYLKKNKWIYLPHQVARALNLKGGEKLSVIPFNRKGTL